MHTVLHAVEPGKGPGKPTGDPKSGGASNRSREARKASSDHDGPVLETRRVLVVDDNQDAASTLAMLLRMKGHEVRVAFSGPEALAAGPEFLPDIILMDLGMPGMNGIEAAIALRREPWGMQPVLLVAVTGWGQDSHRAQTREAGFDLHLVKPVTTEHLDPLLSGHFSNSPENL